MTTGGSMTRLTGAVMSRSATSAALRRCLNYHIFPRFTTNPFERCGSSNTPHEQRMREGRVHRRQFLAWLFQFLDERVPRGTSTDEPWRQMFIDVIGMEMQRRLCVHLRNTEPRVESWGFLSLPSYVKGPTTVRPQTYDAMHTYAHDFISKHLSPMPTAWLPEFNNLMNVDFTSICIPRYVRVVRCHYHMDRTFASLPKMANAEGGGSGNMYLLRDVALSKMARAVVQDWPAMIAIWSIQVPPTRPSLKWGFGASDCVKRLSSTHFRTSG